MRISHSRGYPIYQQNDTDQAGFLRRGQNPVAGGEQHAMNEDSEMIKSLFVLLCLLAAPATFAAQSSYIIYSGGVGLEEREQAPANGTRLVFIDDTGDYLSDIHVVIRDSNGNELINTMTSGPWLVLELPQGRYTLRAERGNDAQGGYIEGGTGTREYVWMFSSR